MTAADGPRSVRVAGWTVTQLDLGAIHAPLTWVDPHADETELAWLPSNGLLLEREGDVVLVDCGLGPYTDIFGLPVRHVELGAAVGGAGRAVEEVSTVVLTHLDPDHAGGVVVREPDGDLRPALGSARIVLSELAADVLLGREPGHWDQIEKILAVLRDAHAPVEALADGGEIATGLSLRAAPGHRVGHSCVELTGEGERFVYLADAIHAREHVEHPEWDALHDSEPETALETRRALIAELTGSGAVIACSHVDGFGRIERRDDGTAVWLDVA